MGCVRRKRRWGPKPNERWLFRLSPLFVARGNDRSHFSVLTNWRQNWHEILQYIHTYCNGQKNYCSERKLTEYATCRPRKRADRSGLAKF